MHGYELLFSLPTSLSCGVLGEWLQLKSLIALNTSFCTRPHREIFLEMLRSAEYAIAEQITISNNSKILGELEKFGEKLRSIRFFGALRSETVNMVAKHCHNLSQIRFDIFMCSQATTELWQLFSTNLRLVRVVISTPIIFYSGPPSTVLSLADVRSVMSYHWNIHQPTKLVNLLRLNNNIARLDLFGMKLNPAELLLVPPLCPYLRTLRLSGRELQVNDTILHEFTAACPHIVHLDISYNDLLTDVGILSMVQNLKGLQSLNIGWVSGITNAGYAYISTYCANTLHTLNIGCGDKKDSFTGSAINDLLHRCPQLRTVYYTEYRYHTLVLFTPEAPRHVALLVLKGSVICEANCTTISQYATKLRILSLYCHDELSYQSFISLYEGCHTLRELYYQIAPKTSYASSLTEHTSRNALARFGLELWRRHRPKLVIKEIVPENLEFSIMDMN